MVWNLDAQIFFSVHQLVTCNVGTIHVIKHMRVIRKYTMQDKWSRDPGRKEYTDGHRRWRSRTLLIDGEISLFTASSIYMTETLQELWLLDMNSDRSWTLNAWYSLTMVTFVFALNYYYHFATCNLPEGAYKIPLKRWLTIIDTSDSSVVRYATRFSSVASIQPLAGRISSSAVEVDGLLQYEAKWEMDERLTR
jgi:hypothetical protein